MSLLDRLYTNFLRWYDKQPLEEENDTHTFRKQEDFPVDSTFPDLEGFSFAGYSSTDPDMIYLERGKKLILTRKSDLDKMAGQTDFSDEKYHRSRTIQALCLKIEDSPNKIYKGKLDKGMVNIQII